MTFFRRHPLVSFFVLAYGLSWAYWIPLVLVSRPTSRFLIYSLSPLLFLGLAIVVVGDGPVDRRGATAGAPLGSPVRAGQTSRVGRDAA